MFFVLCILSILLLLAACDGGDKADLCAELGGHELQVVHDVDGHWQECTRDGCEYRTETAAHTGGTATCQAKAKCAVCNASYGEIGAHDIRYVSEGVTGHVYGCSLPQCDLYAQIQEAHSGGARTCTEGATCEKCGEVYEQPKGHRSFMLVEDENECIRYRICVECGEKSTLATDTEIFHRLSSDGVTCAKCGVNYFDATVEFQLSEDQQSYILISAYSYNAESIVIPAEYKGLPVTEIGEMAFDSSPVKHVVLPDSIEVIGALAFCASDLETIVLGTGIKEIQQNAFSSTKIKSFTFPGSVEIVADATFSDCELLEEVIIQDGVKHIELFAFAYCPNLTSLILPNTLESMNSAALEETPALEYEVHQGLKYLGSATNPYFALAGYAGAINAVIHPDTEFCMGLALFNCEEIVSLEIGNKVRTIEEWALSGMDALEAITVASGNLNYYAINNLLVDTRLNMPVLGCKTSVIPDDGTISEVNLNIFTSNNSIKTIYIPKGIKTVHVDFSELGNLEMIVFESDVEHVIVGGNSNKCTMEKKACYSVFYRHTEEEWQQATIEYTFNKDAPLRLADCYGDYATHYFYSETQPTTEGNYWHYVDGVPTPW